MSFCPGEVYRVSADDIRLIADIEELQPKLEPGILGREKKKGISENAAETCARYGIGACGVGKTGQHSNTACPERIHPKSRRQESTARDAVGANQDGRPSFFPHVK